MSVAALIGYHRQALRLLVNIIEGAFQMLKNTLVAALLAAAIGAGSMASAEAATASLGGPLPSVATENAIVPAAYVKHKRVYHRRTHGPRYRHRHGRYVNFYRGYWYARAWWRPHVVAVRVVPHHARHVEWCAARHPSYNPKTNTWIGRHGVAHRCVVHIA